MQSAHKQRACAALRGVPGWQGRLHVGLVPGMVSKDIAARLTVWAHVRWELL